MKRSVLFDRYKWAINIFVYALKPAPLFIKNLLWAMSSPFSGFVALTLRYVLLRGNALSLGDRVYIGEMVIIRNSDKLIIGEDTTINPLCYIDAAGGCIIGRNVGIAHNVSILTSNHSWQDSSRPIVYSDIIYSSVVIEDDVWIGCGARIMAGVKISQRSVIAAGAIVTKNVPEKCIVAGVPAKIIRYI